jgi:hypothetical protein
VFNSISKKLGRNSLPDAISFGLSPKDRELDDSLSTAQQLYGNWKICFQFLALLGQESQSLGS